MLITKKKKNKERVRAFQATKYKENMVGIYTRARARARATLACERPTFLLAHRRRGTFRNRLRLSERNSILMT